jgi:hypothetical protein
MLAVRENPGADRNVSREQMAAFERKPKRRAMSGMGAWPPTRPGANVRSQGSPNGSRYGGVG